MGDLVQWEHPQNWGGIGVESPRKRTNLQYLRNGAVAGNMFKSGKIWCTSVVANHVMFLILPLCVAVFFSVRPELTIPEYIRKRTDKLWTNS